MKHDHEWRKIENPMPAGDAEAAWCRVCGALRVYALGGWRVLAPILDHEAPTIGNIIAATARAEEFSRKKES